MRRILKIGSQLNAKSKECLVFTRIVYYNSWAGFKYPVHDVRCLPVSFLHYKITTHLILNTILACFQAGRAIFEKLVFHTFMAVEAVALSDYSYPFCRKGLKLEQGGAILLKPV